MFFKGLLCFFIVFLLENPDVIMILLIHIRYFWVTRAPGKGIKNLGRMHCMILITSVHFGAILLYPESMTFILQSICHHEYF